MTTQMQIADAIRNVTAIVDRRIELGERSARIDAYDLIEVLLTIADAIDPPMAELVDPCFACPACGERRLDQLVWREGNQVRCTSCETHYETDCPDR